MDGGGPGKEVQLIVQPVETQRAFLGSGGVHHVAFRVKAMWRSRKRTDGCPQPLLQGLPELRRGRSVTTSSRCTSAFRAASCSNWQPMAPALPPMRTWKHSANAWRCHPSSNPNALKSRPILKYRWIRRLLPTNRLRRKLTATSSNIS